MKGYAFYIWGSYGVALLAGLALLLACAAGGERTLLALRFERSAIAAGEWWRLLGAHFVHLGWMHVLLDALHATDHSVEPSRKCGFEAIRGVRR